MILPSVLIGHNVCICVSLNSEFNAIAEMFPKTFISVCLFHVIRNVKKAIAGKIGHTEAAYVKAIIMRLTRLGTSADDWTVAVRCLRRLYSILPAPKKCPKDRPELKDVDVLIQMWAGECTSHHIGCGYLRGLYIAVCTLCLLLTCSAISGVVLISTENALWVGSISHMLCSANDIL